MWRKRKELTKITLENNILPDIIRLKSKDTLYKCYALVKKCFLQENGSINPELLNVYVKVDKICKCNMNNESQICHCQRKRYVQTWKTEGWPQPHRVGLELEVSV